MVATVVGLRLRILWHSLARDSWRLVLFLLGVVWVLGSVPVVLGGAVWLGTQSLAVRHDALVLGGSVLVVGWALASVLFGLDESLHPDQFLPLGVTLRRLLPALLLAGLVGVPALFTVLVCSAQVLVWLPEGPGVAAVAAVGALLAVVTCLLTGRLATAVGARVLASRRMREGALVVGGVLVALLGPLILGAGAFGLERVVGLVPQAAAVLGWTPLGAAWAAPTAAAAGDWWGVLARIGMAAGGLGGALAAWHRVVHLSLVRPLSGGGAPRRHPDRLLGTVRDGGPTPWSDRSTTRRAVHAVALRAWRYWCTDPRYLSGMVATITLPPVLIVVLGGVLHLPDALVLAVVPIVAGAAGWGRHNDVAFDGTAFWLHVASGVPGRVDRTGRAVAALLWAAPTVVALSTATTWWVGRWDLLPAVLGAGVGMLGVGLAVAAVSSTVLPYPVPPPGASPFATEPGTAGATLLAQLVASIATIGIAAPLLVAFGLALWWQPWVGWVALVLGVAGGTAVLRGAVVLGGRVYDARAVGVLARLMR